MRVSGLHLNDLGYYRPGFVITEGYGRVLNVNYDNFKVDARPKILLLGRWRHPRTRNNLVAGINLNYLNDDQIQRLRSVLPRILRSRNLKQRYWTGKQLLPDIFNDMYRTYDRRYIHAITPATLRFWKPEIEKKKAEKAKARELQKARKQIELGVEPEPEKKEIPEPEIKARPVGARPEPEVPEVPEPEVAEPEPEKETAQQRRERERGESARKRAERGTRSSRELRKDLEQAEEPE